MVQQSDETAIPFHIEQRRLYRGGDAIHHEISFGVVGVEKPATVVIASDNYRSPVILERLGRGGCELPDQLIDDLAVKCFKLMSDLIIEQGGESGWWTHADISPWVRHQFGQEGGERILNELARQVQPGTKVRSTCLVADDDAI